jgi:hypothetical protein
MMPGAAVEPVTQPSAHGRPEISPAMNRLLTPAGNVRSDGAQPRDGTAASSFALNRLFSSPCPQGNSGDTILISGVHLVWCPQITTRLPKKVTLLDGSGQPFPPKDDETENSLPPGVQALVEVRLNSAVDTLRENNRVDLKLLADQWGGKWKKLAFISFVVNLGLLFVAPAWIGKQIDEKLTEPMVRDRAERVIQDKMATFVSKSLEPVSQQANQLKGAIDEMTATIARKHMMFEDQQKRLSSQFDTFTVRAEESRSALAKSVADAGLTIRELKAQTQFSSTVFAAQNGDRRAYDQLWAWSEDSSFPQQKAASQGG